jgi:adenosylhomocysteine nucleosidase
MRRLAVLAASARELVPAESMFGLIDRPQHDHLGSFPHQVGQVGGLELHLIETGVGPERARKASETALLALAPDALISTGYAGALGVAAVGEVILGTTVVDWTEEDPHTLFQASPDLLGSARVAARNAGTGWTQGPVVTVKKVLWRASEKQALGVVSGAVAVDMESAVIAKAATTAGVPFLVVRAVSDRVGDDLPMDFNLWFSPFGSVRCLLQVVKHPSVLYGVFEMKRHASQASESLRRFYCALVLVLESQLQPPNADTTLTTRAH